MLSKDIGLAVMLRLVNDSSVKNLFKQNIYLKRNFY